VMAMTPMFSIPVTALTRSQRFLFQPDGAA
jgi:hypothetical protein